MKKMTLGIVAPVDAGKTTLAETLLHQGEPSANWAELTTGMLFWIQLIWRSNGELRSFPTRR